MKLYEVFNVLSQKQNFDIRMINFNGIGTGNRICEGSPDTVDPSVYRFIHFNEVIGLSVLDDVLVIYINQSDT